MAKLMVMIDVPEMDYDELRKRMLQKLAHHWVDFSCPEKSPEGLALVIVDKGVLDRPSHVTGIKYRFELIGVKP
ncbi:MAG: hypothetical protein C4567_18785 [Deltaproteobacteria bacterium]|nr:MAG: hypothetical protein C4567_18785 [Deltaproteobacteria bacterium]